MQIVYSIVHRGKLQFAKFTKGFGLKENSEMKT